MCAKFGCGPTVVSKKKGGTDRQTDKRTLQLYIVDGTCTGLLVLLSLLIESYSRLRTCALLAYSQYPLLNARYSQ